MALNRYKAWVSIPTGRGGVIRAGEEFVADENDPRVKGGRTKLLGPAGPNRGPSDQVGAAIEGAIAKVREASDGIAATREQITEGLAIPDELAPEPEPAVDVPDKSASPEPEAAETPSPRTRTSRRPAAG